MIRARYGESRCQETILLEVADVGVWRAGMRSCRRPFEDRAI
jgi:hypothetical protein